jgi:hypothetical protein
MHSKLILLSAALKHQQDFSIEICLQGHQVWTQPK